MVAGGYATLSYAGMFFLFLAVIKVNINGSSRPLDHSTLRFVVMNDAGLAQKSAWWMYIWMAIMNCREKCIPFWITRVMWLEQNFLTGSASQVSKWQCLCKGTIYQSIICAIYRWGNKHPTSCAECNEIPNNKSEIPMPEATCHRHHLRQIADKIPLWMSCCY